MEAAGSCHVASTEVEDDQKQNRGVKIRSDDQPLPLPDTDSCSLYEKPAFILDNTSKKHSTDTLSNTPYSPSTVYLTGMPIRYCTETVIEKMMSRYGTIARCTVHTQQSNKAFAFCEFTESSSATEAIRALNGRKLGGQHLLVRPAFKENSSVPSSVASNDNLSNPKRQRQQLDSKIEAIKRKLAKKVIHQP